MPQGHPFHLKNHVNDWFDQKTILRWILNLFWPDHLRTEGSVNEMIFLEKCSAHTFSDKEKPKLPKQLFILFLPPNVTNKHQSADTSMISRIKVANKVTLLDQLLSIFYIKGVCLRSNKKRNNKNRGYKGIDFYGKPHLLDAMIILKHI